MSTATQSIRRNPRAGIRADYLRLVREFPMRPLRNDRDYDAAAEILDRLAVQPEGSLSAGEQDYFETLTLLVEAFDNERFRSATKGMRGVDMLKYLMKQSAMRTADLGRLLRNRGLASLVLNGHRALSKTHIRMLAEHFKVEPSLFFDIA